MSSKLTLSIDFGYKNIGIALVQNNDGTNNPLFAGTLLYDPRQLSDKVEPRAQLRRLRRTRKTKRNRLRKLESRLLSLGLQLETVQKLITFCRRRGYSSLFDEPQKLDQEKKDTKEEIIFRFSREEFFKALEKEIEALLPEDKKSKALVICEAILNRAGDPAQEIRPIRIDNRGASRCAWDGCNNVPPRRDNALRDALSQFIYTVYAAKLRGNNDLTQQVSGMLDCLSVLGKRRRHAGGPDPGKERKILKKAIGEELKLLKSISGFDPDLEEDDDSAPKTWSSIRRNIMNLIEQSRGRNRFCRQHSSEYVKHILEGKPIPFKHTLSDRDLVSRREQILFQKLWRYIEARILPMAPDGIDRIIVERTAFDLLAGSRKQRQEIARKDALEEMYQQGPRFGFKNDLEMLKMEFDGLCAYCGQQKPEIIEREHLLPQAEFFFDSYLNKVPACKDCNQYLKQAASPGGAGLLIHEQAYEAYSRYLNKKFKDKPPHLFHTVKKGVLNLMRQPDRIWEAERYLNLIANQFAQIVGAQRGPRPLARYLSEKLNKHYGEIPEIGFVNGRHTALWREAAYPHFSKVREKTEGGKINHALDAIIMACDLPDLKALEAKELRPSVIPWWVNRVRNTAPPEGPDGIPVLPKPNNMVSEFEKIHPGNFIEADLSKMNWNHKDSKVQREDSYSWSKKADIPSKRVTAASIIKDLRDADKKDSPESRRNEVKKIIDVVIHPQLGQVLKAANTGDTPGSNTAQALTAWLRKAIGGNFNKTIFSSHPADQRRFKMLHEFVNGQSDGIPAFIGVKILYPWLKTNIDLNRVDPQTKSLLHRYVADPANIGMIVAYKGSHNQVNRDRPITLEWRQSGSVIPGIKSLGQIPDGPLKGRSLGEKGISQNEWKEALHQYLANAGIAEYNIVSQGNVAVYKDGSERYIRNFSASYGFKKSLLKGITGVRRSPFAQKINSNVKIS